MGGVKPIATILSRNVKPQEIAAQEAIQYLRSQGQIRNASPFGQGMCQNRATIQLGLPSLINRGRRVNIKPGLFMKEQHSG